MAQQYNGHELWTTLGILQEREIAFEVISTATTIVDEVTYQANTIERTIDEVHPDTLKEFDGLAFVSGNMADTEAYWSNPRTLAYVDVAKALDMPIAAICCSVPTIRAAAKGKRVSFFPLVRSRQILGDAGADLQTISISVDEKLVTAEHQMATQIWADAFASVVLGEKVELDLVDSGFSPHGRTQRRLHPRLERIRGTDT